MTTGGNNLCCSLQPIRSAPFCCAQPRSVKPQITHSLSYETEEEGEMMGGNDRKMRSSTHSGTDKLSAFCLSIVSAVIHSLLPHSSATEHQRKVKISTSFFISILKFRSSICLTPPPHPTPALSSFIFYFPGEVKWSGLLTQRDPD